MKQQIEEIRRYTAKHSELSAAHHFLFDIRLSPENIDYIVMGINPGETDADFSAHQGPTEETSLYDFHTDEQRSDSSSQWLAKIKFYLETDRVLLAEYFFWSSQNAGRKFVDRFGPLKTSPHIVFCRDMNLELITHYKPKAIISPGLGMARIVRELYGLTLIEEEKASNGHNLILRYSDGHRPWIFTKHWSGSHGFSNQQRDQIKLYIQRHLTT